jgi:hypothetical protein
LEITTPPHKGSERSFMKDKSVLMYATTTWKRHDRITLKVKSYTLWKRIGAAFRVLFTGEVDVWMPFDYLTKKAYKEMGLK